MAKINQQQNKKIKKVLDQKIGQINKHLEANGFEGFEVNSLSLKAKAEAPLTCGPDEELMWVHENGKLVQRCVKV